MRCGTASVASTAATNPGPAPPNQAAASTANTNRPARLNIGPTGERYRTTASRMQAGASAYRSAACVTRPLRAAATGDGSSLSEIGLGSTFLTSDPAHCLRRPWKASPAASCRTRIGAAYADCIDSWSACPRGESGKSVDIQAGRFGPVPRNRDRWLRRASGRTG